MGLFDFLNYGQDNNGGGLLGQLLAAQYNYDPRLSGQQQPSWMTPGPVPTPPLPNFSGGGEPSNTWGGPVQGYGDITDGAPRLAGMPHAAPQPPLPMPADPYFKFAPGSPLANMFPSQTQAAVDNNLMNPRYSQDESHGLDFNYRPAGPVAAPATASPFDRAQPYAQQNTPSSVSGLMPFGVGPQSTQPQQPQPQQREAQAGDPSVPIPRSRPDMPQQAGDPSSWGTYGGINFPIFGQPEQQTSGLPSSAKPAQYQGQAAQPQMQQGQAPQLPAALGGTNDSAGVGDRLSAGLTGFAHSNGLLPAISNLVSGLATGQRNDVMGMKQGALKAQYDSTRQALIDNGMAPAQAASTAMLSVFNPDAAKTILPELLSNKEKYQVVGEDQFGGKQYGFVNDRAQTINGQPIGAGGASGGSGNLGYLAKGVPAYDASLPGDQYLQQFAPDVQAAIKSFANGDSTPTGNARKGWAENIIRFAKAWGDKTGQQVNDQTFYEKKKLKTDLGASGNSTMGGILDNGESSFAHLAELGKSFANLGSASYNFPGGGYLAQGQNAVGSALGGSDTKGKIIAAKQNLTKYGQESTKFYAGTGGGVEERTAALKTVPPESSSGEEQAAYMEKEKSLMLDRLNQKFDHIRQTLGEEEGNKIIAKKLPTINKNIATIDASIAKLRGSSEPAASQSQSGGLPSGWSVKVH